MRAIPDGFQPAYGGLYEQALEGSFGPIYCRELSSGYELGLWVERHHCNMRQLAHGGFMTAMGDIACGYTASRHFHSSEAMFVSVSLSHEFIGAVPLGAWLSSACRIRKAGRSTLFLDCEHYVEGELVGLSHLVMKRTRRVEGPGLRAEQSGARQPG